MRLFYALTGLVATFFDSLADLVLRLAPVARERYKNNKLYEKIKTNENKIRNLSAAVASKGRLVERLKSDVLSLKSRGTAAKAANDVAEVASIAEKIVELNGRIEYESASYNGSIADLEKAKAGLVKLNNDRIKKQEKIASLASELASSKSSLEIKKLSDELNSSIEQSGPDGGLDEIQRQIDENRDRSTYVSVFEKPVDRYAGAEKSASVQSVIDSF